MPRRFYPCGPGLMSGPSSARLEPGAFADVRGFQSWRPGLYEKARGWVQQDASGSSGLTNAYGAAFPSDGSSGVPVTIAGGLVWKFTAGAWTVLTSEGVGSGGSPVYGAVRAISNQAGNYLTEFLMPQDGGWGRVYGLAARATAGAPRAPDPEPTLVTGTLLAAGQSRSYKVAFVGASLINPLARKIFGPPSGTVTVSATATQNVSLRCYLPLRAGLDGGQTWTVQVYGSQIVTGTPDAELKLCYQQAVLAADIALGYVDVLDFTPDAWRGADLYTNPSQEGAARENTPPPVCADACLWKGCAWAANTAQRYKAIIQMISPPQVLTISAVAAGTGVYTFSGTPDLSGIVAGMELSVINAAAANNGTFTVVSVNTGAYTITTNNAASVLAGVLGTAVCAQLTVGATACNASLIAASVANNRFLVTTAGSAQQQTAATATSIIQLLNQKNASTQDSNYVIASYASGPEDAAGLIFMEGRNFATFTISAIGTNFASRWNPNLGTRQPPGTISNDAKLNRLAWSKWHQFEHWALGDYLDVGDPSATIVAIAPLRDSLIVLKKDGLFRVTGSPSASGGSFVATRLLPAQRPVAGTAAGGLAGNAERAYALTNRGLVEISDSGARLVGGPVSDVLGRDEYNSGSNSSVYYNAIDNAVHINGSYTPNSSYIYDVTTERWSQTTEVWGNPGQPVPVPMGAGQASLVPVFAGGMYGQADRLASHTSRTQTANSQLAERAISDYLYMLNVSAINAGALNFTATAAGTAAIGLGSYILDDNLNLWQVQASAPPVYTLVRVGHSAAYAFATGFKLYLLVPQTAYVEWQPVTISDESVLKQFLEVEVILDKASIPLAGGNHSVTIYNETDSVGFTQAFTPTTLAGTPTNLRVVIPPALQTCRRLHVKYSHSYPDEFPVVKGLAVLYEPIDGHNLT